jgi:hypothetical protein
VTLPGGDAPQPGVTPLRAAPIPLPPVTRVELAFQYTFAELREGLTTSPDVQPARHRSWARKGWIGWALFVPLAVVLFLLLNRTQTRTRPAPVIPASDAGPVFDAWLTLVPAVLGASVFAVILFAVIVAGRMLQSKNASVRKSAGTLGALAIFVAGCGVAVAPRYVGAALPEDGWWVGGGTAILLALAPWLALTLLAIGVGVWFSRTHLRRQWETKPYLQRRRTIVLDSVGEQSADEMTTTFYRWPFFRRAWETENVLVLLDENDARHVLPKRVMDQTTLDRARALISNHVAECTFRVAPGGFPVEAGERAS